METEEFVFCFCFFVGDLVVGILFRMAIVGVGINDLVFRAGAMICFCFSVMRRTVPRKKGQFIFLVFLMLFLLFLIDFFSCSML